MFTAFLKIRISKVRVGVYLLLFVYDEDGITRVAFNTDIGVNFHPFCNRNCLSQFRGIRPRMYIESLL